MPLFEITHQRFQAHRYHSIVTEFADTLLFIDQDCSDKYMMTNKQGLN